jgi:hypothetical protein
MKTSTQKIIESLEIIESNLQIDHSKEILKGVLQIVKNCQSLEKRQLMDAFEAGEKDFNKCKFHSSEDYVNKTYGLLS